MVMAGMFLWILVRTRKLFIARVRDCSCLLYFLCNLIFYQLLVAVIYKGPIKLLIADTLYLLHTALPVQIYRNQRFL